MKNSLWYVQNGSTYVAAGKIAKGFLDTYFREEMNTRVLKGAVASSGKVKGRVRIIMDPDQVNQIKNGEIMVTIQAVPSMVEAIRRCAGIIADGGTGITSHTATLAREFGKPCIIRTKIATRVLHNGDMVELDAEKGIVNIIDK
jgi:pyruvate,water dikinase